MATSSTSTVYIHVIEDVISKVRDEFINGGGSESILNELQGIWEMKMMQAGAILGPTDRSVVVRRHPPGSAITPVHDLNVPYEGNDEYETPTADMLFPPTPLQTPLPGTAQTPLPGIAQTPLPGTADNSVLTIPGGGTPISPIDYHSSNGNGASEKHGRPSPFMQPPPWMNQKSPVGVDVNVAYAEGQEESERGLSNRPMIQDFFAAPAEKRKRQDFASKHRGAGYIPQQDGAGDAIFDDPKASKSHVVSVGNLEILTKGVKLFPRIPQLDGPIPDPYDDMLSTPNIYNYQGTVTEDYNIASTPAIHDQAPTPAVIAQNDAEVVDDDDEPLNENDDDDDDLDGADQGEDVNIEHLVLAQFEKVTRTKSRWKCTLKDGIMHLKNKDILFNKANGEFEF